MNDWKKVEQEVQPSKNNTSEKAVKVADKPVDSTDTTEEQSNQKRYTRGGRRRGMYPIAAPIGFLVLLLSVVGLISLTNLGIDAIKRARDDTPLRTELYDFLLPVMQYDPQPFNDINETEQDAVLLAAIWRVTEAERIRLLRDGDGISAYPMDDEGRILVPVSEIEESYATLFGKEAKAFHRTIGEEGLSFTLKYDQGQGCYHIPSSGPTSIYSMVIDTVKKKGDNHLVRVGYVRSTKIGRDEKGEQVEPTADMAEKFQIYTVQRSGEKGWKLISIADEKADGTSKNKTVTDDKQDETKAPTAGTTTSTAAPAKTTST
ncbi:MAG: hypothetical protein PHR14_05670 [Oscillospiraceae bacterium]|nr:hypothetical protein [Oscillospiraceae bacterium]